MVGIGCAHLTCSPFRVSPCAAGNAQTHLETACLKAHFEMDNIWSLFQDFLEWLRQPWTAVNLTSCCVKPAVLTTGLLGFASRSCWTQVSPVRTWRGRCGAQWQWSPFPEVCCCFWVSEAAVRCQSRKPRWPCHFSKEEVLHSALSPAPVFSGLLELYLENFPLQVLPFSIWMFLVLSITF